MAESNNDIEFLDEDTDIVQQCVQGVQYLPPVDEKFTPLLVERSAPNKTPAERKRKRKKIDEDDSDYDPSQDVVPSQRPRKRKFHKAVSKGHSNPNLKLGKKMLKHLSPNEEVLERKKCNINIPDYSDPLCLPVKAIKQEDSDIKRLNNWNNVCLEHLKHCDNMLKPERGETNSSTRTLEFRNVVNRQSGKSETTIWSKTCVENEDGDRKSEIFQCVLPRYREKKALTTFGLLNRKMKTYHLSDEVILSKEEHKDGEVLVVYKPRDSLAATYKLVTPHDKKECNDDLEDKDENELKMYMKELLCCKMCVPCFQSSWRGIKKNEKKTIACPICPRAWFKTTYNLLAHFKSHSTEDIKEYKSVISDILAEVMEYNYKCRVCREQFNSIKMLRHHVKKHQGRKFFTCEVGNHVTT